MDSAGAAFSRLSLEELLTPPGTSNAPNSVSDSTDLFRIDKFVSETLDNGLRIFDENDFEKVKFLGSGRTMSVYAGQWKSRSKNVALKYVNLHSMNSAPVAARDPESQTILRSAALELRVLRHERIRSHPNIVDILGVSWFRLSPTTGDCEIYPILIMELACPEHPTLRELITGREVDGPTKMSLLRDVFEGIEALHDLDVVHGDLKPENVLVFRSSDAKLIAKLSDFGFSRADSRTNRADSEAGDTEYWNAPDYLRNGPQALTASSKTKSRDIYPYGLLACFVLLGELPFAEQDWTVLEISNMKLKDSISELFASKWRFQRTGQGQESGLWENLTAPDIDVLDEEQNWEVQKSDGWYKEYNLPLPFLRLIPKMLHMEPSARPKREDISSALRLPKYGANIPRVDDTRAPIPEDLTFFTRTRMEMKHACHHSIPEALRQPLFRSFMSAAQGNGSMKRDEAMVNVGFCMIRAFGTQYNIDEAMVWFARAGLEGNVTGREMVFRLERATKQNSIGVIPGLTRQTRVEWMLRRLFRDLDPPRLRVYVPKGIYQERLPERLLDVFLKLDAELVEKGLLRAIDDSIVKSPALKQGNIDQYPALKPFPHIWSAIGRDDPIPISKLLTSNGLAVSPTMRQALVLATADQRASNILHSLVYDHKFLIDVSFDMAFVRAFIRSDLQMASLLYDLGVPWGIMMGSDAVNRALNGCSILACEMLLGLQNIVAVPEESVEYPPYWRRDAIRQQSMDGIQPLMAGSLSKSRTIDNYNPPIFEMVTHNRPFNLGFALSLGANPNVRYMGMTALHLSVKMLRPVMVSMLLACGADPNARDFKNNLETPLHQISGQNFRQVHVGDDEYFDYYDIFGDKFVPAAPFPDEDNNHRQLIIRLLLEYGTDIDALSDESVTPFMKAILSPTPHASFVAKYLVEMGADPFKSGVHGTSGKGDLQNLQYILSFPRARSFINQRSVDGMTPLQAACGEEGHTLRVNELLKAGADVSVRTNSGLNAISRAMRNSQKDIFDILIDHVRRLPTSARGAVLMDNPVTGNTSIHDSFSCRDPSMVMHFLENLTTLMTDIHRPNNIGNTPLHLAAMNGIIPAMQFLLLNGANVDAQCHQGMTPLHIAYGLGDSGLVDFLICRGADRKIKNHSGMTPKEFGSASRCDPGIMDKFFQEITSIEEDRIDKGPRQKTERQMEQFKLELIFNSQYVPGDRFTKSNSAESSPPLTDIENIHIKILELSISRNGEKHFDSLWRMNNLGCVYERYGRLNKAEEVYRKGWSLSREVFGNKHILVADFANKLMRVSEDFDHGGKDEGLKQWIDTFGQETLNRPFLVFQNQANTEEFKRISSRPEPEIKSTCDRFSCKDASQLDSDWNDPESAHRKECIRSLTPDQNPAIITQRLVPEDVQAREFVNFILSRITAGFEPSDFGDHLPTVISTQMWLFDPKIFRKPTRFRAKKDTVILFLSDSGFRYMVKATSSEWQDSSGHYIMLLYEDRDFWVAPLPAAQVVKPPLPPATTGNGIAANAQMFLMAEFEHLDHQKAHERRKARFQAKDSGINILPCYHAGHPDT
ncbi:hypothetical protein FQN52_004907 [Onygenales sp. PD_12]|nr:hypothetical protein FQN52_004907 [Onygenales sp. PD_12]